MDEAIISTCHTFSSFQGGSSAKKATKIKAMI
jgi:hypothetical protein